MLEREETLRIERWMIPNPTSIQIDKTLKEAAQVLDKTDIDCLPVVGEGMKPVGMVTANILINSFLHGNEEKSVVTSISEENFFIVRSSDSLLDIYSLSFKFFAVIDDQNRLVGIISRNEILKGLSWYIKELEHTAESLNVILESAYEGVAVVDETGIIREFNEAYSRFTGIDKKVAVGSHVEEVIDNTNLNNTVKTGLPERGVVQYIQGQAMVVHRIPIWKNDRVIGAIGMVIFEGVTELYRIYERFQENTIPNKQEQQSLPKKRRESRKMTLDQIIGVSESTSTTKRIARKIAKTNATVLITGESGTGKEMYAKGIHHLSALSTGPFISVNCGAIPENLFESELFGYAEGAFTGAKKGGKPGKFELAQNGTLFLDEIAEMPLMMQTKLLRILQEKEFERVGGIEKYEINTRIIAATNRNLKEMVKAGDFREDLFYRINVIELPILPLRERTEDIPPLVSNYLYAICTAYQMPVKSITPEAMSKFVHYHWHGNIRELMNTIEKLVVLVDGATIDTHHLPEVMIDKEIMKKAPHNEQTTLIKQEKSLGNEREKVLIKRILKSTEGNKSKAAEKLGIHRTTLYQKLKKYKLQ
ncbi:sigma 54-interacting transcriptional regulator [Virgibacillus sp. NKC19-16]|nr:sigma 54-interacting transcriptional regulator [Virgibacillus sp. NKC19-16]